MLQAVRCRAAQVGQGAPEALRRHESVKSEGLRPREPRSSRRSIPGGLEPCHIFRLPEQRCSHPFPLQAGLGPLASTHYASAGPARALGQHSGLRPGCEGQHLHTT